MVLISTRQFRDGFINSGDLSMEMQISSPILIFSMISFLTNNDAELLDTAYILIMINDTE